MGNFTWDDDVPAPDYDLVEPQLAPKLELVKPPEPLQKIIVDMQNVLSRCKDYPTLDALLKYHQSQGFKVVESFAFASSLTALSYLYSHSYEVGVDFVSRKMPLNLFIAIAANTGFEKTGYMGDCRSQTIQTINRVIHKEFGIDLNSLTTYLPSSEQGLQKLCREMPTRVFILDEAKSHLKAKAPSPKYDVFETLRHMFDKHIYGLSVTKKEENNNKATDWTFATILIGGTTEDMKKHLLSQEKLEDGTANRFLLVGPSSWRSGSKKPQRWDKSDLDAFHTLLEIKAKAHIKYEIDSNMETPGSIAVTKSARRVVKDIYSKEIEGYFQTIAEKNDVILDEYDANGAEIDPKVLMLTRQMVIKMRIAYLLWIDSGFTDPLRCAFDANDMVEALNRTSENLYENRVGSADTMKKKILSLRNKKAYQGKIYLGQLFKKKGPLDENVYGNLYKELEVYLRTLSSLNQIELIESNKKIMAFSFTKHPDL